MRSSMNPFKATVFATAGLAAAVVIAIAATGVLLSVRSGGAAGQTASPSPTVVETAVASPTTGTSVSPAPQSAVATQTADSAWSPRPGPTMMAGGLTTPGITSGWTGFTPTTVSSTSTSFPTRILKWSGGYAASAEYREFGPSNGLWTSPDGIDWKPVRSINASRVFVAAAPVGLVAIAVAADGEPTPPWDAWTSSDGVTWRNAGWTNITGNLVSLAGTDSGIVAVVSQTTGTGKSAVEKYHVFFSTNGFNWGEVSAAAGISAVDGQVPHVQSGNGRFFLMGVPGPIASRTGDVNAVLVASASPHDVTLWSDDGRSWTKCGGAYTGLATKIDFGRDGLLMETDLGSIPGGTALARSADGGKTWQADANFGPLGSGQCTGECSSGPDGQIVSNGTYFLAVKADGSQAWLSFDGRTWSPLPWGLGSIENGTIVLYPRGVSAATYGAAK